jgi:hypothetical protein
MVDPAKVAKIDTATQHALIAIIQKAGVGLHNRNEFEQFIAFYHSLDCADLDEAAKFKFSDESIENLPPLLESPENEPFWRVVTKAYYRMTEQEEGTSTYYGPAMLDANFLEDHPQKNIPFPILYRDIKMFYTMVDACAHSLKNQ